MQWLLELRETAWAEATVAELQRWREASAEHERAWQQIAAVNRRLLGLKAGEGQAEALPAPARAALLTRAGGGARRRAIRGVATVLVGSAGAWLAWRSGPMQQWTATLRTGRGERLERTLEDGSQITLAGGCALNLDFGPARRRLALIAGEVFVATAHSPGDSRPFLIDTRFGSVQALGTRYSVRLVDSPQPGALASVFDGAIRLTPAEPGAAARELQAGQQALLRRESVGSPAPADPNRAAWASGSLVAQGLRLDAFLAELALHAPFALDCDPAVAGLRLSGSFPIDDVDRIVESVARLLTLRVETRENLLTGRRVRLLAAAPSRR